MADTDYRCTIEAPVSVDEAFARIARVSEWWLGDVTGDSRQLGDKFTVRSRNTVVDFEVSEAVPPSRLVWHVTGCHLPWLSDTTEWTGTSVEWTISPKNGGATVEMVHRGLTPDIECYESCNQGWTFYIGRSLLQFLTTGTGLVDQDPH